MKWRWRLAWVFTYPLAKLFLNLEVKGREKLRINNTGLIVAANHTSNLDPIIVGWAIAREVYFLAKEELFRYRPFAWLIKKWNALPVSRGALDLKALRRCGAILRQKGTLILFPEGTRSQNGQIGEFKPGVGMLAVLNRVPVVPVYISGLNGSILSYWVDRDLVKKGWRKKPRWFTPIRVFVGNPVFPEGVSKERKGYEEFTRLVEEKVRALARSS